MRQGHSGWILVPASVLMLSLLAGCLGSGSSSNRSAQPAREHDDRIASGYYQLDVETLQFSALDGFDDADRWWGAFNGAGYRIEVPANWNGTLVMYAHGYRGDQPDLTVDIPELRGYFLGNGYAWAASSYSANHYDVRAGVEDTNLLARNFIDIANQNGRELIDADLQRTLIIGQSMGGHVAGAAIEAETRGSAKNFVQYDGALAFCGVMADAELLTYFTAYNLAAMELAGVGADEFPVPDADNRVETVRQTLWENFDADGETLVPTAEGEKLGGILMNLSGGDRPVVREALVDDATARSQLDRLHDYADNDGTAYGILAANIVDTRGVDYRFETAPDEPPSQQETDFNGTVFRVEPGSDPNPPRSGLRWMPPLNGEIEAPMLTLHTLGDLWVPFSMQQEYARRVEAMGRSDMLVQRAIRAIEHCDFTLAEQEQAFADLVGWVDSGSAPAGDDVLTAATVADPAYGCAFTIDNGASPFPCPD